MNCVNSIVFVIYVLYMCLNNLERMSSHKYITKFITVTLKEKSIENRIKEMFSIFNNLDFSEIIKRKPCIVFTDYCDITI